MDDGLVPVNVTRILSQACVLILIVVDDGLVRSTNLTDSKLLLVLILIVVDDGLVPPNFLQLYFSKFERS